MRHDYLLYRPVIQYRTESSGLTSSLHHACASPRRAAVRKLRPHILSASCACVSGSPRRGPKAVRKLRPHVLSASCACVSAARSESSDLTSSLHHAVCTSASRSVSKNPSLSRALSPLQAPSASEGSPSSPLHPLRPTAVASHPPSHPSAVPSIRWRLRDASSPHTTSGEHPHTRPKRIACTSYLRPRGR